MSEPKIVIAKEDVVFSLTCINCDAGGHIDSMEQAVKEGWRDIQYDDGPSWNFLGMCPECWKAEQRG